MTTLEPFRRDPAYDAVDFLPPDQRADLTTCDREPIHLSAAIQGHGALLAATETDLVVRWASANTGEHLGQEPTAVLGARLETVLGGDAVDRLRLALLAPHTSGAIPLTYRRPGGVPYALTWHRVHGLVVIELEPADVAGGRPMSALFDDIAQAMSGLQATESLQGLCDTAAEQIKALTGYDRVMVYRFHRDDHGEVVAEAREPELEAFLGLNYPASDIPAQARKLFQLNHLRVIADVAYQPVPLLAAGTEGQPLDLSLAGLRSVSPMHIAYLGNMGVRASLTISLMSGTQLWGMLACHHNSPKRIDAQMRAACRLLGQVFSLQIVAREREEYQSYRVRLAEIEVATIARLSGATSLAAGLGAESERQSSPLALTGSDGMVARIDGQTVTLGDVPTAAAVVALLARLCAVDEPVALACDDLPLRFPELAAHAERVAGVIAVPLTAGFQDYVLWFRAEQVVSQRWAGDPQQTKTMLSAPPGEIGQLSPRMSFESWALGVRGHSRPWNSAEIDAAHTLAGAIPELMLARSRDRLAHLALHDPLTGVPNRALLIDRVTQALARQQRGEGGTALLFLDLDRFKLVNDALGHAAGDDLLSQAAARLVLVTRTADTVARLGGDEFVVLCENVTTVAADELSERVVTAFRQPFLLRRHEVRVTVSVGVAFADDDATPAGLLRDADTAMYRAKQSGRNSSSTFTADMREISLRKVEIETGLAAAVDGGDLQVYYQPVHSVASGALIGFEALSRWYLDGRGMVSPSEFIPVAEASGLVGRLTDGVLREGLAALAGWRARRPDLQLTLAVNIVATQMATEELQASIDSALRDNQLPAEALCLEITESALVADDPLSQRFLARLRKQGVRLSIDDFGTGYSSLSYLTKLPVHELKVDQGFVAGLPTSTSDLTVVSSVVALAHQLGMTTVAEGVETQEQLDTIARLDCDSVQGYLLGRPMAADGIDRFLDGLAHPDAAVVSAR
jgi:diguanylate cyclase (GGDEF)-like protein